MHGFGGGLDSLRCIADRLKKHFSVTLIEFIGAPNSPYPDYPLTLDDYVEAVAAIVRHYRMKSVTIVGHSFGGRVALKYARCNGHLLDRLVLIDSAGLKPRRSVKYRLNVGIFKLKKCLGLKVAGAGSADYRTLTTDAARATFKNIVNTHLDSILPYVTAPTLLIWGKNDRDTPLYMAKRLQKGLYKAYLKVLDGGHFCYAEQPETVAALISAFLS